MMEKIPSNNPDAARAVLTFTRQNLWRWLVPQDRWKIVEARPDMLGTLPTWERLARAIADTSETLAPEQGMAVLSANRLGLKYLAGATPVGGGDAVSDAALERGCGSFTKNEIRQALSAAGIREDRVRWYYPYPDLDLPTEIFSDAWLPDVQTFTENAWDVYAGSNRRWQLFDEAAVGRTAAREGLFGELCNAFAAIVLPEKPDADSDLPVYVRFSHQRDAKYRIQTAVYQDRAGARRVEKTPLSAEAAAHLARMHEQSEALSAQYEGTAIAVNRSRWEAGGTDSAGRLLLEYVTGTNVSDLLEDLLAQNDEETFCSAVDHYFAALSCTAKQRPFLPDDETFALLGRGIQKTVAGEASLPVTNLDPVFSNVLMKEDGTCTLIDCEWTVTCPVPVSFLFYRCLFRFFYAHPEASALCEKLEKRYGITPEKKACFEEAEAYFQQRVKGDSVSIAEAMTAAGNVGLPLADAMRYIEWERQLLAPAVRFVYADDSQDEEAVRRRQEETLRKRGILPEETPKTEPFELSRAEGKNEMTLETGLPAGQLDEAVFFPCLLPGTLTLYELCDDQERPLDVLAPQAVTESETEGAKQFHFLTSDPAVHIRLPKDSGRIRIVYAYDAIIPGGVQQQLPLAGLRRNASADIPRRNTLLSELVSLRPLPDLVASQQGRIEQLDGVIASQQGMVEQLQQTVAELGKTIEEQRQTAADLQAQCEQLRGANEDLAGQLEAIKNSASWKLTQPMRSVMGTLRGDHKEE